MKIIHDPAELQHICFHERSLGNSIALVPTMGFLHAGHLALLDKAKALAKLSILSIFVNPSQFAPHEDLKSYPRNFENDCRLAKTYDVDILFAPSTKSMYHSNHSTWVEVPKLAQNLCATSRPTHFKGVCTIVAKLFLLASPSYALFGQKDWQQLAIIRRMAKDLHFPIEIVGMPIIREPDGLALSSRNVYLSTQERKQAPYIYAGLTAIQKKINKGEHKAKNLTAYLQDYYHKHIPTAKIDYIALVHPDNLSPVETIKESTLLATALKMSKARLIDNMLLKV